MKIGILTFHNAFNFGAVLQAYGLKYVLQEMGHKVDVVNYCNSEMTRRTEPFNIMSHSLLRVLKRLLFNYSVLHQRSEHFKTFCREYLAVSGKKVHAEDLGKFDYDLYVIGSDQVWNPYLTGGVDPVYWGKCFGDIPVVTYAASSNDLNKLPEEMQNNIDACFIKFRKITVRENRLRDYISQHIGVSVPVVVDPTVLAGRICFEKFVGSRPAEDPYLLYYSVEGHTNEVAVNLAVQKGLRLVVLDGMSRKKNWPRNTIILEASVPEFISAFRYADLVVCTSFHGTVFSLLFERDFYSIRGGNMARVETLLEPLGLTNRIVSDCISDDSKIDYSLVTYQLNKLRENSKSVLEEILK